MSHACMKPGRITAFVAALLVSSFILTNGACRPLAGISRLLSTSKSSKDSNLAKTRNMSGKNKAKSYKQDLEKLLTNPSLVYVIANSKDKGGTAIIKSEDDSKTTSIPLEVKGSMIAVDPEGKRAYVTAHKANKILVLDAENNRLIKTIDTKDEPYAIASNPNGSRVYITHHKSNYISVLDTNTYKIINTLTVKQHPAAITVSYDGSKAYVGHTEYTNYSDPENLQGVSNSPGSNEISIIDLKTNKVISNIATKGSTWSIAVKSDGSQILATTYEPFIGDFKDFVAMGKWNKSWNGITVIDAERNKISSEIQIPEHIVPRSIALTPDEKKAYVVGSGSDEARVLDVPSLAIKTKIALGIGG